MWLVFLLFIFLLGIVFSNIEINLCNIYLLEKNYNFKISISLKLFGIFKILFVDLDRFGIKFFNKKIFFNKSNLLKKIDKETFKLLENLNIKLKKVNFVLKVGLIDIGLTNIAVVIFSTIFPIYINNRIERKKVKYKILPEYNKLYIDFKGKFIVSMKFFKFIKFYLKNIKTKTTHNKNKNYNVKESLKYE